ncbi:hypothetical protein IG631_01126 [Alternaria alternata]|nr:hypothetical protein IG631_01126 [Alternaria alternata]
MGTPGYEQADCRTRREMILQPLAIEFRIWQRLEDTTSSSSTALLLWLAAWTLGPYHGQTSIFCPKNGFSLCLFEE